MQERAPDSSSSMRPEPAQRLHRHRARRRRSRDAGLSSTESCPSIAAARSGYGGGKTPHSSSRSRSEAGVGAATRHSGTRQCSKRGGAWAEVVRVRMGAEGLRWCGCCGRRGDRAGALHCAIRLCTTGAEFVRRARSIGARCRLRGSDGARTFLKRARAARLSWLEQGGGGGVLTAQHDHAACMGSNTAARAAGRSGSGRQLLGSFSNDDHSASS